MQTPEEIMGRNLSRIRRDRGYSQRDLLKVLGWTQRKVSTLELGQTRATPTELYLLCAALHVTLMELLLPGDRALTPKLVNVRGIHLLDSISSEDYAQVLFGSLAASMTDENLARMRPAGMLQSIRDRVVLHHPEVEASVTHIRLQTQVLRILSLTEAAFAAGVSDSDRFSLKLTDQRDGSPIDAAEFARRHGVDEVSPQIAEERAESAYGRYAEHWRIQIDYERITAEGIEQRIRQGLPGPDLPRELPPSDDDNYQTTVDRITELYRDPDAVAAITEAWLEAIGSGEEGN